MMGEHLDSVVQRFLAHRRALGRKYHSEEAELAAVGALRERASGPPA